MNLIPSFQVDHTHLKPGLYVSRCDACFGGYVTTFDVRMTAPNAEPAIHPNAAHTIEHVVATYLRNSDEKENIVYFGPMGCLTGFYLLMKGPKPLFPRDVEPLVRRAFRYLAAYRGEVPGATKAHCGNYLLHDLPMAKLEAKRYLSRPWRFAYPKARRLSVNGKVFFDA